MQRWRRKVKWLEILNRQRRPVQHSTWIDNDTYRHTIPSCVMLPQLMRVWVPPPWKNPCPAPSDQQTDWLTTVLYSQFSSVLCVVVATPRRPSSRCRTKKRHNWLVGKGRHTWAMGASGYARGIGWNRFPALFTRQPEERNGCPIFTLKPLHIYRRRAIPNERKGKKQKNKILFSSVNKRKRKRVSYRHCQWVKQMIRLKNNPILFAFTVKWGINMWSWGAAERIPPALLCRARHAMCSRRSSYR